MISYISLFDTTDLFCRCAYLQRILRAKIFLKFLHGIKTLLANVLSTFFIYGEPTFINGPKRLPRNPPSYIIFDISAFDKFILTGKLFSKSISH